MWPDSYLSKCQLSKIVVYRNTLCCLERKTILNVAMVFLLCVRPVDVNGSIDRLRTCEMKEKIRGGKARTPYKYAVSEFKNKFKISS